MDKSRTEILLSKEGLNKLASSHVTIVGTGGVGGYAAVMLARAGVENFRLIDFDKVSTSNINRQIVAYQSTLGKYKVDVLEKMFKEINSDIKVECFKERLTEENISTLIGQTDIVIDAIDSVNDKVALIVYCKENNIEIISAMGAGNRWEKPQFALTDIYKTSDDGLAKAVRKNLKEMGIKKHDVIVSLSKTVNKGGVIGSISYYPAMMGCYIASVVIEKIIKEEL